MYLDYWNLDEKPFENVPDPHFLFNSTQHEEAFSRLLYIIKEHKGAGMLTGVFGCGKTLVAKALMAELEKDMYEIAFIVNPRLNDVEMLRMIGYQLSGEILPTTKSDVLIRLENILLDNKRDGKSTMVIIDEAHSIEDKSIFEELRLLLNYQSDDKFLIMVILIGQPELREKIDSNKQLSQRIALRYHLQGLGEKEVNDYIDYRMEISGAKKEIFKPEAKKLIYENSGGIPRRINQLCDMCLLTGFSKKAKSIGKDVAQEAISSIEG